MTKLETVVLGGGCFWCLDAVYRQVRGVESVTSGYAGGQTAHPTYEEVSGGQTGHAEVVKVEFDPAVISYAEILEIFWGIHDPTTPDRQGSDVGNQYRSIIFYANQNQRTRAAKSLDAAQKLWERPIVTEIKPLADFYSAEDYHQDYFAKNPAQAYCQLVINPKLAKFRQRFGRWLKNA